ncbi:homeobox-leucine zipper protein ROC8-like [Rhodamnia argentea]|uniref:Homeobox-leucine zipper protein ROC8-like n=1 Tax=Rhodamnia argentea TaxID=178133 RepID=A0ABM3GYT0_9MYRT|nr:homeobox-leucine zipper protein ROC8-like [Rhodamnia argentea]
MEGGRARDEVRGATTRSAGDTAELERRLVGRTTMTQDSGGGRRKQQQQAKMEGGGCSRFSSSSQYKSPGLLTGGLWRNQWRCYSKRMADSGGSGGSGEEHEHRQGSHPSTNPSSCSRKGKGKTTYHRHTTQQTQRLETFFKDFPHPDENQRHQLSRELGLDPKQIKFWFQNKRTQRKTQNERADNTALRAENERIHCENLAIMEALKSVICPACGGPPLGEEERQRNFEKLKMENVQLKAEHAKISNILAKYIGKPISHIESLMPRPRSADVSTGSVPNHGVSVRNVDLNVAPSNPATSSQLKVIQGTEMANTVEITAYAMEELIRIVRMKDPLWIESPLDGRYLLHHDTYEQMFSRNYRFRGSGARVETSKESVLVTMEPSSLVSIFQDVSKWADMFHTIVTKASSIQVLEEETQVNHRTHLQLIHSQMHVLSPLVPARDVYFLRRCQQIEPGKWVIVDVSYNQMKDDASPYNTRRLPSGCLIQDMGNGCSKVTWVEHVEVEDKYQAHKLFRDLVCGSHMYGAERWAITLQRMCERFAYTMLDDVPTHNAMEGAVIVVPEGRRNVMKLAHRMVKNFCAGLNMSSKLDFPHLSEVNNSGVRVCVRKSEEPGQPSGTIVSAATTLWLPLVPQVVFNFFRDENTRVQWDVLCNGNSVQEIARIQSGTHRGNAISIIQSSLHAENLLTLQESSIDPLTCMVVYAPIDSTAVTIALSGGDTSTVRILPSGFTISSDGRANLVSRPSTSTSPSKPAGTLLTVAFQTLVSSPSGPEQLNVESVATVNTLISATIQKIKVALKCSGPE